MALTNPDLGMVLLALAICLPILWLIYTEFSYRA
jgi:hypothetical protein